MEPFAAAAARLHRLFTWTLGLAGYKVGFDLNMLQAEFQRAGLPPLAIGDKAIVDPYQLWRAMEPQGLQQAHQRFVGNDFAGANRAQAEVAATAVVLAPMLGAFGLEGTWSTIAELRRAKRRRTET